MLAAMTDSSAADRIVMLGVDGGPRLNAVAPDRPWAKPALALVVDGAVFSGDTAAPDANLIELARGCDVLVHEVQDNDNVQRIADSFPNAEQGAALKRHLLEAHSDVRDVPRVAHAAGAGRVVFSHYTPLPQSPSVYLEKAQAVADEIGYAGEVIAPAELDVIPL